MVHGNAPLSELGRLRLARCVVDEHWPLRRAAQRFQVSPITAARWAGRYRQLGAAGMADRSSRPHRSPGKTPARTERRIINLLVVRRWGPARIGYLLGLHPSTVHRVLSRYRLARLAWLDRATGQPIRRYEHPHPGDLIHLDVKKLGKIPDGGGWRVHGRATGTRNARKAATIRKGNHRASTVRRPRPGGKPSILAVGGFGPPPTAHLRANSWHARFEPTRSPEGIERIAVSEQTSCSRHGAGQLAAVPQPPGRWPPRLPRIELWRVYSPSPPSKAIGPRAAPSSSDKPGSVVTGGVGHRVVVGLVLGHELVRAWPVSQFAADLVRGNPAGLLPTLAAGQPRDFGRRTDRAGTGRRSCAAPARQCRYVTGGFRSYRPARPVQRGLAPSLRFPRRGVRFQ